LAKGNHCEAEARTTVTSAGGLVQTHPPRELFPFSWTCWDFFLCLKIWSILEKVPQAIEKICIAWVLGEILCRHLFCPFSLTCAEALMFSLLIFRLDDLPIGDSGVLRCPTIITVLGSICALRPFRVF
jgi:hypothetical protein